MERLTFKVPQMDCSAEEQLVRMKLEGQPDIAHLAPVLEIRDRIVGRLVYLGTTALGLWAIC